jgi:hypothetical protein
VTRAHQKESTIISSETLTGTEEDRFDSQGSSWPTMWVDSGPGRLADHTNGLEDLIDWDDLERRITAGAFDSYRAFRLHTRHLLREAGITQRTLVAWYADEIFRGLFPEFKYALYMLPYGEDAPRVLSAQSRRRMGSAKKLSDTQVREIRNRHANGERVTHLAKEFGVSHGSVSGIVHMKAYRGVAA